MFSNAPENYTCPFCLFAAGATHRLVFSRPADIVHEDERLLAFICARQWPNNRGHVLIIPREHYENIFDLPDALGGAIHALARRIAVAMKHAYRCDGISTRQHNEPHGNQEVYHYHLHVYPRYRGDNLYGIPKGEIMAPEERAAFAAHLRFYLDLDARQRLYAGQVAEPCALCDGRRC